MTRCIRNTCSGNLGVPLVLLLSLWEFQMRWQLKKEVTWPEGIFNLIGAVEEEDEGQGAPQSLHPCPWSVSGQPVLLKLGHLPHLQSLHSLMAQVGWDIRKMALGCCQRSRTSWRPLTSPSCFLPYSPTQPSSLWQWRGESCQINPWHCDIPGGHVCFL